MPSIPRALNTQTPISELEAISWRRPAPIMEFTVPPAPSEEGRIIPLSPPPPRVRKTLTSRPPQDQGQEISIRGGAWPSKASLHGLLEENTSRAGVDLLPKIREEFEYGPLLLNTDTSMEGKRDHAVGRGPSRGKGAGNASRGDSRVLMVDENSQQRVEHHHQSRSSPEVSSEVFSPSKFLESVFRFQVDGERLKDDEGHAGSQRRSFSVPTVTLRDGDEDGVVRRAEQVGSKI
ncbi:uncharacterized protein EV420DRAFT_820513 [Desarmillaria tabescens]|uniref:Uncharacterized protein n=1 Tax=Armillaria tabescens TaxID=1929756 RepID=A0AA39NIJ9_ARMTA|nr:uncharacterized protein EV420DRAFT_820513 [Desarmillaria tabescens]KAK0466293.1 hypothetical protein EV420DRAFT_820513 [Desarmillaria tabescens]